MFHESPTATADMAVPPGVLGCSFDRLRTSSPLRRTVQVRLRSNTLRLPSGKAHLHGLARGIHETSRLAQVQLEETSFLF